MSDYEEALKAATDLHFGGLDASPGVREVYTRLLAELVQERQLRKEFAEKLEETSKRVVEMAETNKKLCLMTLEKTKEDFEQGMRAASDNLRDGLRTIAKVVEVGRVSSCIVVPLARRFPDYRISQTNDGKAYISWNENITKEGYELGIFVSFKHEHGLPTEKFIVEHDVEGLQLPGWPKEAATIDEVFQHVELLRNTLEEPAVEFILKQEMKQDEARVDELLKSK